MQHFLSYPTSGEFVCGADALGRRNSRRDVDPSLTECSACRRNPAWVSAALAAGMDGDPESAMNARYMS